MSVQQLDIADIQRADDLGELDSQQRIGRHLGRTITHRGGNHDRPLAIGRKRRGEVGRLSKQGQSEQVLYPRRQGNVILPPHQEGRIGYKGDTGLVVADRDRALKPLVRSGINYIEGIAGDRGGNNRLTENDVNKAVQRHIRVAIGGADRQYAGANGIDKIARGERALGGRNHVARHILDAGDSDGVQLEILHQISGNKQQFRIARRQLQRTGDRRGAALGNDLQYTRLDRLGQQGLIKQHADTAVLGNVGGAVCRRNRADRRRRDIRVQGIGFIVHLCLVINAVAVGIGLIGIRAQANLFTVVQAIVI